MKRPNEFYFTFLYAWVINEMKVTVVLPPTAAD